MISSTKDLSTTAPLSTIAPERVNTSVASSDGSSREEDGQAKTFDSSRIEENRVIQELRARDREVRAHEAAHIAAGREYVRGGPNYTLQQGPDGRAYAIGGEVKLDTSPVVNDPEATLHKAEIVRRAALAPAEPSPQDVQVASNAQAMAARARIELAIQRRNEQQTDASANSISTRSQSMSVFQQQEEPAASFSQYA